MKMLFQSTALAALLFSGAAQAQDVTIRYSNWLPTQHFLHQNIVLHWADEVEKATDGRVKINVTPKVVGSVAGQYDVVTDGLADMALVVPGYTPGRFSLVDGLELPFLGDDGSKRSPASWRTYEKHFAPTGIFDDVHVITLFTSNAAQIFTGSREIRTAADLTGLKLRSPQPMTTELLTLVGAIPVSKPVPEIYELASGGVIDGGLITPDTIISFKLDDVLPIMTTLPGGVSATVNMLVLNKDVWEQISEADRTAIEALSGETLAAVAGQAHRREQIAAVAALEAEGGTINTFGEAELAQLNERLIPLEQNWLSTAKAAGIADPAAVLTELKADIARD